MNFIYSCVIYLCYYLGLLEVSADKTKYMVVSRDQNAGRNHSVRIDNSTFREGGRV